MPHTGICILHPVQQWQMAWVFAVTLTLLSLCCPVPCNTHFHCGVSIKSQCHCDFMDTLSREVYTLCLLCTDTCMDDWNTASESWCTFLAYGYNLTYLRFNVHGYVQKKQQQINKLQLNNHIGHLLCVQITSWLHLPGCKHHNILCFLIMLPWNVGVCFSRLL